MPPLCYDDVGAVAPQYVFHCLQSDVAEERTFDGRPRALRDPLLEEVGAAATRGRRREAFCAF